MSESKHTAGPTAIWSCKIGVARSISLPMGCDAPMRAAVRNAFYAVAGEDHDFCFSGWSAQLTEPELACVENRSPDEEWRRAEMVRDAAPDLLEAAKTVLAALEAFRGNGEFPDFDAWERNTRAAILKATGGEA